jgi:hypothetical protein
MLEEMGFDTSKYNVEIKGNQIEITGVAQRVVADAQINNDKLFRRWITAQTFRMIYEPSYNFKTRQYEVGWDNYLRNRYDYKYQFTMMLEEIKVLMKLQVKDKEEFWERRHFFNKDVVVDTCKHYMRQLNKYVEDNWNSKSNTVKLAKYGTVDLEKYTGITTSLTMIISDIQHSEDYTELYANLKRFVNKMNKLPYDTSKCREWKSAFKGSGAYYSLKNMILFHKCLLPGCETKQASLNKLESCLDTYRGDYWKFHYMLLETIKHNNFDLRESINRNK